MHLEVRLRRYVGYCLVLMMSSCMVIGRRNWMDIFRRNCGGGDVVISDVRFGNEADLIREMGGCVIYLDSGYGLEDGHESERVDLSYDYVLENRGTLEDFYGNFESLYLKIGV